MLQRGRNIHRNNRLNKPRLRYIKIHGEGFRQWHISKKSFRATYRVIGIAEIILQSDNTTKKPDMGTQILGFLQIRDIPWSEQHICSNSSEECQQGNSAKNRSILQPKTTELYGRLLQIACTRRRKICNILLQQQLSHKSHNTNINYKAIYQNWGVLTFTNLENELTCSPKCFQISV